MAREEEDGADAVVWWGCLVVVDVVAAGLEVDAAGLRAVEPEAEERVDWGVLRFGAIGCGAVLGRCGLGWCWGGVVWRLRDTWMERESSCTGSDSSPVPLAYVRAVGLRRAAPTYAKHLISTAHVTIDKPHRRPTTLNRTQPAFKQRNPHIQIQVPRHDGNPAPQPPFAPPHHLVTTNSLHCTGQRHPSLHPRRPDRRRRPDRLHPHRLRPLRRRRSHRRSSRPSPSPLPLFLFIPSFFTPLPPFPRPLRFPTPPLFPTPFPSRPLPPSPFHQSDASANAVRTRRLAHAERPDLRRRAGAAGERHPGGVVDPARGADAEALAGGTERVGGLWTRAVWERVEPEVVMRPFRYFFWETGGEGGRGGGVSRDWRVSWDLV